MHDVVRRISELESRDICGQHAVVTPDGEGGVRQSTGGRHEGKIHIHAASVVISRVTSFSACTGVGVIVRCHCARPQIGDELGDRFPKWDAMGDDTPIANRVGDQILVPLNSFGDDSSTTYVIDAELCVRSMQALIQSIDDDDDNRQGRRIDRSRTVLDETTKRTNIPGPRGMTSTQEG